MRAMTDPKRAVKEFWDRAACGEELYLPTLRRQGYEAQARQRYALEPYILEFAQFESCRGKKVLEVGVGLGADHQRFAEAGAELYGIDLTERAVDHTRRRLALFGLPACVMVGDAEALPFPDESFDMVYSWGVLHHTPNTPAAVREVFRVLRPGGVARVMLYHKWSFVGFMLWTRYALLAGKPSRSLRNVYAQHLESPGTQAFSRSEVRRLFADFREVRVRTELSEGDLLLAGAGQRHRGPWLALARRIWPRWLLRRVGRPLGLFLLVEAVK